ncbi:hypothetical protein DFH08DRAFT_813872 [Mycena albidolilacea]|uniref:Uncharacterized protein n=1 Tax=Mycena albidolilacea TaxID=1033008 RepID=A0AAD7EKQ3_9AGAR|nr:hypothetical protein DFH08DRAFT_813872 [Mycena albidolilacea]
MFRINIVKQSEALMLETSGISWKLKFDYKIQPEALIFSLAVLRNIRKMFLSWMEEKQKYIHAELPIQSTEVLLVSMAHLLSRTSSDQKDFLPGTHMGFGFWIGGWGCVPRTREEEPDSGVLRTGVLTGSKTEGCLRGTQANQSLYNHARELVSISQGKRQRVGVLVLSSERGVKTRPEQRDENKSTPGSSPRTKQSSQTSRGHQGVMSIKESTGGTQGTPVTIQECSHLGRDIRSEYPPT